MAALTKFYPYVTVDVNSAAIPSVEVAVRDTLIDFCERSLLLQVDHDPITVVAGEDTYDLAPPDGYLVAKIMRLWYDNEGLTPVAPDNLGTSSYVDGGDSTRLRPVTFVQRDPRSVTVVPKPDARLVRGILMRVALKPTRDADEVDDVLYDDWAEVIGWGAKYRLLMTPAKEYSNPQAALAFKALYDQGLARARALTTKGYGRANLSVALNGGFA